MTKDEYLKKFKDNLDRMYDLTSRKNKDYSGHSDDPFASFKVCEGLSLDTAEGFLHRMCDKLSRVSSLIKRGDGSQAVVDEKVTDTLFDLAVYSILFKLYLEDEEVEDLLGFIG